MPPLDWRDADLLQQILGRAIRGLLLHRGGSQFLRRIEIARGQRLPGQLRFVVRGDGHLRAGLRQARRVDQRQAHAAVGPGCLHQLAEISIGGPGRTGGHLPVQRLRPAGSGHRHLHGEGAGALIAAHDHRVAVQPQGPSPLGEDLGEGGRVGDRLRPKHGTLHGTEQLGAQLRAGDAGCQGIRLARQGTLRTGRGVADHFSARPSGQGAQQPHVEPRPDRQAADSNVAIGQGTHELIEAGRGQEVGHARALADVERRAGIDRGAAEGGGGGRKCLVHVAGAQRDAALELGHGGGQLSAAGGHEARGHGNGVDVHGQHLHAVGRGQSAEQGGKRRQAARAVFVDLAGRCVEQHHHVVRGRGRHGNVGRDTQREVVRAVGGGVALHTSRLGTRRCTLGDGQHQGRHR